MIIFNLKRSDLVKDPEQVVSNILKSNYDLVLLDIDFGKNSINGFDILESLKYKVNDTSIWICSNRCVANYASKSIQLGAKGFFPKPLTYIHLLKNNIQQYLQ